MEDGKKMVETERERERKRERTAVGLYIWSVEREDSIGSEGAPNVDRRHSGSLANIIHCHVGRPLEHGFLLFFSSLSLSLSISFLAFCSLFFVFFYSSVISFGREGGGVILSASVRSGGAVD